MEKITGIPEAGLAGVLSDIAIAKMVVISITRIGSAYTIVYGPPASAELSASGDAKEPLPTTPPAPNMDDPNPPPAGPAGPFVHARGILPKTILYVDAAGREEVREGGSRSWRNANPGNIKKGDFASNCGAIGDDGSFAIFPDESAGTAAIISLLKSKAYIDLTLRDAVFRYAPPVENQSQQYADMLSQKTGIALNVVLSTLKADGFRSVAKVIREIEGWVPGTIRANAPPALSPAAVAGGVSSAGSAVQDWMTIAKAEAALPEMERSEWPDPGENPRILKYFKVGASWVDQNGDETDWCAAFVNYCLVTGGQMGTNHPGARSFFWNKKKQFVILAGPVVGAIAVRRYAPFNDPAWTTGPGHVGFVTAWTNSHLTLLGGNQSKTVKHASFERVSRDGNGNITAEFVAFLMPVIV